MASLIPEHVLLNMVRAASSKNDEAVFWFDDCLGHCILTGTTNERFAN